MAATILVVDDERDLELLISHKFRRQISAGGHGLWARVDGVPEND